MIEVRKTPTKVYAGVKANAPLAMAAYAIQGAFEWFLAEGVWSFRMVRKRVPGRDLHLDFDALVAPKKFAVANFTQLGMLAEEGYIPYNVPEVWKQPDQKQVLDRKILILEGQHRASFFSQGGETILASPLVNPKFSIHEYAFGLADMIAGLLTRGATEFKWQLGMDYSQLKFNIAFDEQSMRELLNLDVPNFNPDLLVQQLP